MHSHHRSILTAALEEGRFHESLPAIGRCHRFQFTSTVIKEAFQTPFTATVIEANTVDKNCSAFCSNLAIRLHEQARLQLDLLLCFVALVATRSVAAVRLARYTPTSSLRTWIVCD